MTDELIHKLEGLVEQFPELKDAPVVLIPESGELQPIIQKIR